MIDLLRFTYLTILTILGFYCIFTFKTGGSKIIKLYALLNMITEGIGFSYLYIFRTPAAFLYNFSSIIEIFLWFLYLKSLIRVNEFTLKVFFIIYVLVFSYIGHFDISKVNINGYLLNNIIIVICIGSYFFILIKNSFDLNGHFWIMVGALFYNLGGFLHTGMVFLIIKQDFKLGSALYSINSVLNIVYYSFFIFGIYQLNKKEPEGSLKVH